jgi:hypothetical protein
MKAHLYFIHLFFFGIISTVFIDGSKNTAGISPNKHPQTATDVSAYAPAATIPASAWTTGALPDTTGSGTPTTAILKQLVIPNSNLKPLNITLGGPNLLVSNNPERFTGDGWLMQHNRVDPTQGGVDYPLTGTTKIYFFHLNYTFPATTKYIHLIMHNAGTSPVTYSAKGSCYTNAAGEKPLSGAATGQSYWVSRDWISNTFRTNISSTVVPAGGKEEIFKIQMSASNMVDGLFEVNTSGPVYYYTIVTSAGATNTAKAATSGSYASYAVPPTDPRVTQSDYRMETGGTYGREAGVYSASEVSSDNILAIPDVPSRIGFCFNTANKFFPTLENQNAPVIVKTPPTTDSVRLINASSQSYGNYGMYYDVLFRLQNNSVTTKNINVYFAENENLVDAALSNGAWNSRFKVNGSPVDIYIQRNNPRKLLATIAVPTGTTNATINVYIPGLITTNHQLIFETTTVASPTLPVSITNFSGKNNGDYNTLSWTAGQELGLSHYELQKGTNENNFNTIETIQALNNQSESFNYSRNDLADKSKQVTYYRLKTVDHDGKYAYSKTVAIANKENYSFQLSDNPFTNSITIKFNSQPRQLIRLSLYNQHGTLIRSQKTTGNGIAMSYTMNNLNNIPAGTYTLEVVVGNKTVTQKVIKLK